MLAIIATMLCCFAPPVNGAPDTIEKAIVFSEKSIDVAKDIKPNIGKMVRVTGPAYYDVKTGSVLLLQKLVLHVSVSKSELAKWEVASAGKKVVTATGILRETTTNLIDEKGRPIQGVPHCYFLQEAKWSVVPNK